MDKPEYNKIQVNIISAGLAWVGSGPKKWMSGLVNQAILCIDLQDKLDAKERSWKEDEKAMTVSIDRQGDELEKLYAKLDESEMEVKKHERDNAKFHDQVCKECPEAAAMREALEYLEGLERHRRCDLCSLKDAPECEETDDCPPYFKIQEALAANAGADFLKLYKELEEGAAAMREALTWECNRCPQRGDYAPGHPKCTEHCKTHKALSSTAGADILEDARHSRNMMHLRESRKGEIAAANRAWCEAHGKDPELILADTYKLIAWLWEELERLREEVKILKTGKDKSVKFKRERSLMESQAKINLAVAEAMARKRGRRPRR